MSISFTTSLLDPKAVNSLKRHEEAIKSEHRTVFNSMKKIGQHLLEAKFLFKSKTEFEAWVEDTFNFKVRTAYNMISGYLLVKDYPALERLGKDSIYYIAGNKFPKDLVVLLDNTMTEDMNLTKRDLIEIKNQFDQGECDALGDFIRASYQSSREKKYSNEWVAKGEKFVKDVRALVKNLEDAIFHQKHFVGAESVANDVYDKIADQIEPALLVITEYLRQNKQFQNKRTKEEGVARLLQDVAVNQTTSTPETQVEDQSAEAVTSQNRSTDETVGDWEIIEGDSADFAREVEASASVPEGVPASVDEASGESPVSSQEHHGANLDDLKLKRFLRVPGTPLLVSNCTGVNNDAGDENQLTPEDSEISINETVLCEVEGALMVAA